MLRDFKTKALLTVLLALGSFWSISAHAATLSISPSLGDYSPGDLFSVTISVSSPNQSVNAFSGSVSFPVDKLEALSALKTGSIINFWAQEPTISNQGGEVRFEGLALNPGFIGNFGKLLTLNFKVKSIGLAKVSFSSGSVLANDGIGTNVLTDMFGGEFNILSVSSANASAAVATTPSISAGAPSAPKIFSRTHPDPEKWYSGGNVEVYWEPLPEDVTAVRTLFNKSADALPNILNSGSVKTKKITDVADGVWYFHIQLKNKKGWGSISHFRINIDSNPPAPIKINFLSDKESSDPRPTVSFTTFDSLSGIAKYQAKIGNGDFFDISDSAIKANIFMLPNQLPGKHTLLIQAIDKAGNKTTAYEDFNIFSIDPPKIIEYQDYLQNGELLNIEGTTYPNLSVYIFITKAGETASERHLIRSNPDGKFTWTWPKVLGAGKYVLRAQAMDNRGAVSADSEACEFNVSPDIIIQIGPIKITDIYLSLFILLALLILIFGGIYGWYINFRHKYGFHRYSPRRKNSD